MAKNSIRDFSATAGSNTDIQSVNIDENCPASGINNAIRELMVDLKNVSTGAVNLETPAADSLTVAGDLTVDTNTLKVDSSNNRVGINTTSPDAMLQVQNGDITVGWADNFIGAQFQTGSDFRLGMKFGTVNRTTKIVAETSDNNGEITFETNGSERMRVDSSGNVGIGTSSPVSQLTLAKTNDLVFTQNGYGISWGSDNGSPRIFGTSGGALSFKHGGGSTAVTIDTSGTVLVGSTSFAEDGSTNSIKIHPHEILTGTTSTSANTHLGFSNPNGRVGSIVTNGSSTAFNTSSDYRLKENIADMVGAIDRVKALAPKRFNFIADADTTVDGFLAHEAQAVVPEAVTGTHNEVDDDGNPVMQGIDQSKLVPLLCAALKESIAKIETFETEMTALKARVTALEA